MSDWTNDREAKIDSLAPMSSIHELFAANLRKCRQNKALTQEQLAEISGVASEYISRLEAGKRNPTLTIVQKLADALKVEVVHLFMKDL